MGHLLITCDPTPPRTVGSDTRPLTLQTRTLAQRGRGHAHEHKTRSTEGSVQAQLPPQPPPGPLHRGRRGHGRLCSFPVDTEGTSMTHHPDDLLHCHRGQG